MRRLYYDSDIEIVSGLVKKFFHVSIETSLKEQRVYEYLSKYMYAAKPDYKPFKNTVHQKIIDRNTVWVCWLQGIDSAPKLVKRCVETIRENVGRRKVIFLSEHNYKQYIRLPREIEEKKVGCDIQHFFFRYFEIGLVS